MRTTLLMAAMLATACSTEFVADDDTGTSDAVDAPGEMGDVVEETEPPPCDIEDIWAMEHYAIFQPDIPQLTYVASTPGPPFDQIRIDMFYGYGDPPAHERPGTYHLASTPDERNYESCGVCVLGLTNVHPDSGDYEQLFFQTGGQLVVDSAGVVGETFAGSLHGLTMEEVTLEGMTTVPVPGGEGWCIDLLEFEAVIHPYE